MTKGIGRQTFVLCIDSRDCDDLEKGKIYRRVPDAAAKRDGYLRIIDESGDDYLYPEAYFVTVKVPAAAQDALSA